MAVNKLKQADIDRYIDRNEELDAKLRDIRQARYQLNEEISKRIFNGTFVHSKSDRLIIVEDGDWHIDYIDTVESFYEGAE